MDISSLLSPQDTPVRTTAIAPAKASARKPRRTKASPAAQKTRPLPLSRTSAPSEPSSYFTAASARPAIVSTSSSGSAHALSKGAIVTPPIDASQLHRQSSTSGMDTLADLASMQQHQQAARTGAGGFRSTEGYENHRVSAPRRPIIPSLARNQSGSRGSLDMSMTDAPVKTPSPRIFEAVSLSAAELQSIAQLVTHLADNPYAYESHAQLVRLLHHGLIAHVERSATSKRQGDPATYELLQDLKQATEAMDARFALGEELWVSRIQDQELLATSPEDCLGVMELCQQAVNEETGSTGLWKLYGEWMLSIYKVAHPSTFLPVDENRNSDKAHKWSDEDKAVAEEAFGLSQVLDVWRRGAEQTIYRIHDSHLIWDQYTELLLHDMEQSPTNEAISGMKHHFIERLQVPHAEWDRTFQTFSSFISRYDNDLYEETMTSVNRLSADAKAKYEGREGFEARLQTVKEIGDKAGEWSVFNEYLEWELSQNRKKHGFSFPLANALYQRAILRFPTDPNLWEDYMVFLVDEAVHIDHGISPLPVLERATRHCPWSGNLWSQFLQAAERESQLFTDIGHIKHKATSTGLLDAGGLEEVLKVHTAWCGFLRRRAFQSDSTEEEVDVAEVGIRSAIEDMETLGRKKYGKEYQGDPQYRLERIYIKYLSQSQKWQAARDTWKSLIPRHGNGYEFWLRYYNWEMIVWGRCVSDNNSLPRSTPVEATKVLREALKRPKMDWPEKVVDTFMVHCEDHESVEELQSAVVQVSKVMKIVKRKREKEAATLVAQPNQLYQAVTDRPQESKNSGKRKRKENDDTSNEAIAKKAKPEVVESTETEMVEAAPTTLSTLKRDREHSTVIVYNLPLQVTEVKVRQYFRDCGTINSLKLKPDDQGASNTATIEFDSKEDALTAQTKDMKTFDGNTIEVHVGTGSTLFVTNFPPTADEKYVRDMFSKYGDIVDVRFPSLKYNTHRRFCYVQFTSASQAQAATRLDNYAIGDTLKLVAKISDPSVKKGRSGALYDGREVYVANVDWSATEQEITKVFSKYGTVEKVRIPKNLAGMSKGMAFVVFSKPDEATAALDLNLTKFRSRILNVSISTNDPSKRHQPLTTRSRTSFSASPQPPLTTQANGTTSPHPNHPNTSSTSPAPQNTYPHPTPSEISSRTLALLHLPDTVNDARLRTVLEPYGSIKKLTLRPDHQGAIVEFADVASAGKAALGIEGLEIVPGRKVGVGSVKELFEMEPEKKVDRIVVGKGKAKAKGEEAEKRLLQTSVVRRPALGGGGRRGGKGGLGSRGMGVGLSGSRAKAPGKSEDKVEKVEQDAGLEGEAGVMDGVEVGGRGEVGAKSNADFKAMFLKN